MYPEGLPSDTIGGILYYFREGFNPSGNRFIAFAKDARMTRPGRMDARTEGFSMDLNGKNIKYFYREPSHHFWLNDEEIMDNGYHTDPITEDVVRGYDLGLITSSIFQNSSMSYSTKDLTLIKDIYETIKLVSEINSIG